MKITIAVSIILAAAVLFLSRETTLKEQQNPETIAVQETTKQKSEEPKKQLSVSDLHYDAVLVDTHNDFLYQVYDKGADFSGCSFTHSDLPRFKQGGIDVQFFSVWIPMDRVKNSYAFVQSQINRLQKIESEHPNDTKIGYTYDDAINITAQNKLCMMIGVEGGTAVNSVDDVNSLYELGVRYISLTWNNSNKIGSSARDEKERGKEGGLTTFGTDVIKRMNETGMMIDISHLGEETFWDVVNTTTKPVVASHSNTYAVNPHYRNLTDEQILAIAQTGGVVQVNFHSLFLDKKSPYGTLQRMQNQAGGELEKLNELYGDNLEKYNQEREKLLTRLKFTGGVSVDKVIEHIDHIVQIAGIDHVGLGSDFDGGITPADELYDVSCYPVITQKLSERGYKEEDIRKILGLNMLRVIKEVCR